MVSGGEFVLQYKDKESASSLKGTIELGSGTRTVRLSGSREHCLEIQPTKGAKLKSYIVAFGSAQVGAVRVVNQHCVFPLSIFSLPFSLFVGLRP